MKWKIAVWLIIFAQVFSLLPLAKSKDTNLLLDSYRNMRFWDIEVDKCFFKQVTNVSCVSASVQMVLKYLDFSPLPNQSQLAIEMHTDINHTTYWKYAYIPLKNRGFLGYYNHSLSDDFSVALSYLKGNFSQNFPVIVNTWYDEHAKSEGRYTHARVITGYDSEGIFFHDPWSGPNMFLNYSVFSSLWKTDLGFWAFIIKAEPKFDLIVEAKDLFGLPISGVVFVLEGEVNKIEVATDSNGVSRFSNLTIANYALNYNWRLQSETSPISLTKTTTVSFIFLLSDLTIIGIAAIVVMIIVVVFIIWTRRRSVYWIFS